mgnify:CR=1 FL=1
MIGKFGPRLTGSSNLIKACEWAKAKFESFGLKAELYKWGEWEVGFDRGKLSGQILSPEAKKIDVGTNSWAAGTNGPEKGPAVLFPKDADDVKANKASFKDAWVLIPRGKVLAAAKYNEEEKSGNLEWELQEAGIHGFIGSAGGELILTSGRPLTDFSKLPTRVTVRVTSEVFKELTKYATDGKPAVVEFNLENKFVKGPVPLYDVIADIRGTEKPDEYVIIGGHIDSWDGAQGATDNGTGVATTLEVARVLAKLGVKPKRTIRFMLWSGEEQGLLGSQAWIAKNQEMLAKISAVLVHDEGTNYVAGMNIPKAMEEALDPIAEPLKSLDPKYPFVVNHKGLPMGVGSDHDSFLQAGVPGFFWDQKGDVDYNHGHHTQFDTLSVVRHDYQKHSTKIIASVALGIANLPEMLPRENMTAPRGARGLRRRRAFGQAPRNPPERRRRGLLVGDVNEGGVADKCGMKANDLITKIGDTPIANVEELRAALAKAPNKTTITIKRDGKEMVLNAEWPEAKKPAGEPNKPASAPAR